MTENKDKKHNEGFTLLELSVVIVIIGVMIGGVLAVINPMIELEKRDKTKDNMAVIIEALSHYAQRNNRIPCPADSDNTPAGGEPFGTEIGSGGAGTNVGSCAPVGGGLGTVEGIVPFRALGLNEQEVVDGWGYYITYRVSPAFARDTTNAGLDVHARCRIDQRWVIGNNINPDKARFCCPSTQNPANENTDIRIFDDDTLARRMWLYDRSNNDIADEDAAFTLTSFDIDTDNVTAPAFILVSHGMNHFGAFLADGSRPDAGSGNGGNSEQENYDGDRDFVITVRNTNAGNAAEFDDIIEWRTQDQLYAETGVGSCTYP